MDMHSTVSHVLPDEQPFAEPLHQGLHDHARESWELDTAFPQEGAGPPGADAMGKACRMWPARSALLNGRPKAGHSRDRWSVGGGAPAVLDGAHDTPHDRKEP